MEGSNDSVDIALSKSISALSMATSVPVPITIPKLRRRKRVVHWNNCQIHELFISTSIRFPIDGFFRKCSQQKQNVLSSRSLEIAVCLSTLMPQIGSMAIVLFLAPQRGLPKRNENVAAFLGKSVQ
jgi:hypothetical protein